MRPPGRARPGAAGGSWTRPPAPKNPHEAEEIGAILGRWLSKNRVKERLKGDSIFVRWKEVVGDELAAATRVVRCAAGVLTVEVSSAPLLNELATYRKNEILRSVQSLEEFRGIREIRFKAGSS